MTVAARAAGKWAAILFLVCGGIFLFSTQAVHAQGLVQCGIGATLEAKLSCQFCDLFRLVDTIIRYLMIAGISIAAVMFTYAGFTYFTSGGSTEKAGKAKTIFIDVVVGFIFALIGYLIVNTLLNTLATGYLSGPSWNSIQCVARNVTGDGLTFPTNGSNSTNGGSTGPTVGDYNPIITSGACSVDNMINAFGAAAAVKMSCICGKESSGKAQDSTTDLSWVDGKPFSTGYMQVNMVTTPAFTCNPYGEGNVTFNCSAAFSPDQSLLNQCRQFQNTSTKICGSAGWAYSVVNQGLYDSCRKALATPQCNMAAASYLFSKQGYSAWAISSSQCN